MAGSVGTKKWVLWGQIRSISALHSITIREIVLLSAWAAGSERGSLCQFGAGVYVSMEAEQGTAVADARARRVRVT